MADLTSLHNLLISGDGSPNAAAPVVFSLAGLGGLNGEYSGPGTAATMNPPRVTTQSAALGPSIAPAALDMTGGGSVDAGSYLYAFSWLAGGFETAMSPASVSATSAGGDRIQVTSIEPGTTVINADQKSYPVTARYLYRSNDAGTTWHRVAIIAGNSQTAYVDSASQASIASAATPLLAGEYLVGVIPNDYITPGGTYWELLEGTITSELDPFNHSGSILEVATLYASSPTPTTPTVVMYEYILGDGGGPRPGVLCYVWPVQMTFSTVSDGVFPPVPALVATSDVNGRVQWNLPKGSQSNPLDAVWNFLITGAQVEPFTVPDSTSSIYAARTGSGPAGVVVNDETSIQADQAPTNQTHTTITAASSLVAEQRNMRHEIAAAKGDGVVGSVAWDAAGSGVMLTPSSAQAGTIHTVGDITSDGHLNAVGLNATQDVLSSNGNIAASAGIVRGVRISGYKSGAHACTFTMLAGAGASPGGVDATVGIVGSSCGSADGHLRWQSGTSGWTTGDQIEIVIPTADAYTSASSMCIQLTARTAVSRAAGAFAFPIDGTHWRIAFTSADAAQSWHEFSYSIRGV